jgi:hypothetical protein
VARVCGGYMALTVHRAEAVCADSVIRVSSLCVCVRVSVCLNVCPLSLSL